MLRRARSYCLLYSRPPFCLNFGGLWTIKFTVQAGTLQLPACSRHSQTHRGATSHPSQAERREKKGKKKKNETNFPEQRKGKAKAAICHIHIPERAADGRHVAKHLGKDASARLWERGTGRVCFVQANRDLAG